MFLLGFLCGVVLLLAVLWWLAPAESSDLSALRARQELAELERRTVQQLLAAELAARGVSARPGDVVDGSATELWPRS